MKNSERSSEQIKRRRAEQTTEEYRIRKRERDKKYRELRGIIPKEILSPEEAKRRLRERKRLQKKQKYDRNNDWINNFKKNKTCAMCGYNEHQEILQFHHTRKDKEFNISKKKDKSLDTLKAEIEKCILLCPNCHNWLHCIVRKNNSS